MRPLGEETFAFLGRLERLPRWRAVRELERRGARVLPRPGRGSTVLVIGHGARRLTHHRIEQHFRRASGHGPRLLSENRFLELLGWLRPVPVHRSLSIEDLTARSGLNPAQVELLTCLDLLDGADGRYGFEDLLCTRQVARLIEAGADLSEITASVCGASSGPPHRLLARLVPRRTPDGLMVRLEAASEDGGQFALPLPAPRQPDLEELFEQAEQAESDGDLDLAAQLYRRCVALSPRDATAFFNLANVLREQGDCREAELALRQALAIDPRSAEAWYNLADLLVAREQPQAAKAALQQALDVDPCFADAIFNLAQIELASGRFGEAAALWERYLGLDAQSAWSRTARRALGICRLRLRGPAAG